MQPRYTIEDVLAGVEFVVFEMTKKLSAYVGQSIVAGKKFEDMPIRRRFIALFEWGVWARVDRYWTKQCEPDPLRTLRAQFDGAPPAALWCIDLALARWEISRAGDNDLISLETIAMLAHMSLGSVRNAASASNYTGSERLQTIHDGRRHLVPAVHARTWLASREPQQEVAA